LLTGGTNGDAVEYAHADTNSDLDRHTHWDAACPAVSPLRLPAIGDKGQKPGTVRGLGIA
jgi:hypothetical protein